MARYMLECDDWPEPQVWVLTEYSPEAAVLAAINKLGTPTHSVKVSKLMSKGSFKVTTAVVKEGAEPNMSVVWKGNTPGGVNG